MNKVTAVVFTLAAIVLIVMSGHYWDLCFSILALLYSVYVFIFSGMVLKGLKK